MYERFTDKARKVMQLANQEAMRFNHCYIGTEHILLGLIHEGSGVAACVLKNFDVNLRKARLKVEKLLRTGPDPVDIATKLPQTSRAKKVIEYAIEESRSLGHNYVGTEHILLGLLREQEGVAAQVLMNMGLNLTGTREEVVSLLCCGIRSNKALSPPRPKPRIEDLPQALKKTTRELDAEIQRINDQKWEAVQNQDFPRAACLRNECEKLQKHRKALIRAWLLDRNVDPSWLAANDGAVAKLAKRISENRSWSELPMLAEALQQAGCADREMLDHCRQSGEHSDDCWVVELLLGNA